MVRGIRIVSLKRARLRDYPRYHRVEITLELKATIVDLFHNSAAGYRAQYYYRVKTGEWANQYVIRKLCPGVLQLLVDRGKRTCPVWWVERSLAHPEAKLWIHQGSWLRHARKSDGRLRIRRWLAYKWAEKHKDLWSSLAPGDETRIDIKGAPVALDGTPLSTSLKPTRGQQIHDAGFT
jgi:hypothetical protein